MKILHNEDYNLEVYDFNVNLMSIYAMTLKVFKGLGHHTQFSFSYFFLVSFFFPSSYSNYSQILFYILQPPSGSSFSHNSYYIMQETFPHSFLLYFFNTDKPSGQQILNVSDQIFFFNTWSTSKFDLFAVPYLHTLHHIISFFQIFVGRFHSPCFIPMIKSHMSPQVVVMFI